MVDGNDPTTGHDSVFIRTTPTPGLSTGLPSTLTTVRRPLRFGLNVRSPRSAERSGPGTS